MTRTTFLASIATTVLLAGAPAFAGQLASNAGLTDAEAAGMSLTEIAQAKFNADGRRDDARPVSIEPATGSGDYGQLGTGASLTEIAAVKFNSDGGRDDQQTVRSPSNVTVATRNVDSGARTQLIASAGISPADAAGMSLSEIAAAKFANDLSQSDR